MPSQKPRSHLPVGTEPVFSLCPGIDPWDLDSLQVPPPQRKKEAEIPSICAGSHTLSTAVDSPSQSDGPYLAYRSPTEQGMSKLTELVAKCSQGFRVMDGSHHPHHRFLPPDLIGSLAIASGTRGRACGGGLHDTFQGFQPLPAKLPCGPYRTPTPLPPLSAIFFFPSCIHHPNLIASSSPFSNAIYTPP